MKLVSFRAQHLRDGGDSGRPQRSPRLPSRPCVIELATDSGLTGIGFAELGHLPLIQQLARELLFDADPRGVTGLWQRMVDATSATPYAGAANAAIAALDLALWDLKAKANDEPLWRALGASRPRLNVHASLMIDPLDAAGFAAALAACAHAGFRGACLQTSGNAATDEQRSMSLRDALAANTAAPALMLDFDERFAPKESARRIAALERQLDLTWVEAPARRADCAGYKRVSDACSAAVCGGRWFGGPDDFLAHFRERSLDVVQIGFQTAGITGALQIAETAFGFELPVATLAAPGDLNAHLAAVLPLGMSLEMDYPRPSPGSMSGDVHVEAGWAHIGERPGHGVLIDPAALEAAPVHGSPRAHRTSRAHRASRAHHT